MELTPRGSLTMEQLKAEYAYKKDKKKFLNAERSKRRLLNKTVRQAEQVYTTLQFGSLPISKEGWMGTRMNGQDNAQMRRKWSDRTIAEDMDDFQMVPFDLKYLTYHQSHRCHLRY